MLTCELDQLEAYSYVTVLLCFIVQFIGWAIEHVEASLLYYNIFDAILRYDSSLRY